MTKKVHYYIPNSSCEELRSAATEAMLQRIKLVLNIYYGTLGPIEHFGTWPVSDCEGIEDSKVKSGLGSLGTPCRFCSREGNQL